MDRQLWLHQLILDELKRSEALYKLLEKYLEELPIGSLLNRNGHMYRAFRENGQQFQKPINDNYTLLKKIKLRQYVKKALPKIKKKIKSCRQFLETECIYDPLAIEASMREIYHGVRECNIFLENDICEESWRKEEYSRNTYPFEEEHYTDMGLQVRSKAEAMIGTQMEHKEMLFRVEPEIRLSEGKVYPDFEIFLPNIRRRVYLEHFGKMDDPKYLRKVMFKLMSYHKAGLYLGINFFFTWETKDKPLNTKEINAVLDEILGLDR